MIAGTKQSLSRTSTVKAVGTPKSIGERILALVPNNNYTGQLCYEVNCKDGRIETEYLNTRQKVKGERI